MMMMIMIIIVYSFLLNFTKLDNHDAYLLYNNNWQCYLIFVECYIMAKIIIPY